MIQRINEEAGGIQHLEHLADRTLDSKKDAHGAINHLKDVVAGKHTPKTKIDDRMSFHVKREHDGRVGVKYKGTGAHYNYSHEDIDKQHGHKPYLAHSLHHILDHAHKVLPHRAGEWQGGFMSTKDTRHETSTHISHTPNTVTYSAKKSSPEGKKLKRSKVSLTLHSELKGPHREAHPVSHKDFREHPDVHIHPHDVEHAHVDDESKKKIQRHLTHAELLLKGHDASHHEGHSAHMRSYIHSTVSSGETPSTAGYHRHLSRKHDKAIEAVSSEKAKATKRAAKEKDLAHINKHEHKFDRTFEIHHHVQQAVNHTARAIDRHKHHGIETSISGKPSGGEGYVSGGHKIVDREEFTKANRARSELLRAKKA